MCLIRILETSASSAHENALNPKSLAEYTLKLDSHSYTHQNRHVIRDKNAKGGEDVEELELSCYSGNIPSFNHFDKWLSRVYHSHQHL